MSKYCALGLACLSLVVALGAKEVTSQDTPRASVKVRSLTEEQKTERARIQSQPDKDAKTPEKSAALSAGSGMTLDAYFYGALYPALHQAVSIGYYGESVSIEDGSIFAVRGRDQWLVRGWPAGSLVTLAPNHGHFFGLISSGYDLCLVNTDLNEKVEVDLVAGPFLFGPESLWITGIDYYTGFLYLNDGSILEVDSFDRGLMSEWLLNEHVILGCNDGWHQQFPFMVVNVASVDYVRVRFVQPRT